MLWVDEATQEHERQSRACTSVAPSASGSSGAGFGISSRAGVGAGFGAGSGAGKGAIRASWSMAKEAASAERYRVNGREVQGAVSGQAVASAAPLWSNDAALPRMWEHRNELLDFCRHAAVQLAQHGRAPGQVVGALEAVLGEVEAEDVTSG